MPKFTAVATIQVELELVREVEQIPERTGAHPAGEEAEAKREREHRAIERRVLQQRREVARAAKENVEAAAKGIGGKVLEVVEVRES